MVPAQSSSFSSISPASPIVSPFLKDLGVEFLNMENGDASIALTLLPRHMNGWDATHGGVTMTLLDAVMSLSGRSLYPDTRGGVTVEMKTSFFQPGGISGQRLVAKGKVSHHTLTLCFCEGEIWSGEKLVAKAMGTFKYLRRHEVAKEIEPYVLDQEQTAKASIPAGKA